ncbi:MAG: DJ-1/PfpI family protein [Clostridia bacterium]|nr:DJ-1/PfpI family protein [Clostridia bacterium]
MVYVMLATGFEEIEALAFTDILRRAGIDTKTVSVYDKKEVTGSHGITVVADMTADEVNPEAMTAIVLPGGLPGTYNLRDSDAVKNLIKFASANNKLMGAICAAPYVYDTLGYLDGKNATVNPGFESEMKYAKLINERVVIDGNLITSQGPGTAHEFAGAFISVLKGEEAAQDLLQEMLYR